MSSGVETSLTLNNKRFLHSGRNDKLLKDDLEELDALPFSRLRVDDDALRGRAVFGGRHRVEHLERVPATDCSRDHSLNLGSL